MNDKATGCDSTISKFLSTDPVVSLLRYSIFSTQTWRNGPHLASPNSQPDTFTRTQPSSNHQLDYLVKQLKVQSPVELLDELGGGVFVCHWSHKQELEEAVVNAGGNQAVRSAGWPQC